MMIAWQDLFAALALVFVVEGMLPFLRPERWRKVMVVIIQQPDKSIRIMGLFSMLMGVSLLYAVR